jgi:multidrug efflux pump subunit AcrB
MSPDERKVSSGFFHGLVNRPITLLVLFVALLVIGVISYVRIPLQLMPDGLTEPGVWVEIFHPGASALENEEKVARPMEEQLRTLTGVKNINSNSGENSVGIWVSFDVSTNMDFAKAEVRDRIERARGSMPTTVREIGIFTFSMDQIPIVWMALLHPGDSERNDFLVDNVITRRLEAVDGVGRIDVDGLLDDSVRILLDEERVFAANLDIGGLIRRLSSDNFSLPMGEVTDGGSRIMLRSDMRFSSPEEIANYPIGNGLRLNDVGRVIHAKTVRNRLAKIDGAYSFEAAIYKDSQANTVATCKRIEETLAGLREDPRLADFEFLVLWNQGETIEGSLNQLKQTALWGGGLAIIVLFVFLRRVRTTLAVALSIPFSVILSVTVLYFAGGTFNLLTMCGITLALGMLVDNSVVVIENVARLRAKGLDPRNAAVVGARDVALAVSLATLTTIVVFLPMIFMTENPILRLMFAELGLPLCIALAFSLLGALVFLPVMASRIGGGRGRVTTGIAHLLAPITRLPVRLVACLIGGVRALWFAGVRGAFALNRIALGLLAPIRWVVVLGVIALLAMQVLRVTNLMLPFEERMKAFGADGKASPLLLTIAGASALGAALIALLALPLWNRRPKLPPQRPAAFVPQGDSMIDFMVRSNQALVAWSLKHRILAVFFAFVAFLSGCVVKETQMEMTAFGEDEDTGRLTIEVDLEENFTLEEADREMAHYDAFFEERKEQYGFEHISTSFRADGGRVRLYWGRGNTRENLEATRRDVIENLVVPPGHTVRYFEDEAAEDSRSKNVVTWRIVGPDSEELERYGLQAIALLEGLPDLTSLQSPLEDAPGQVQVVMDSEQANSLGVTADMALDNIAWALRGWQLPRYQEEGREIPLILEYDEEELAGLSTLKDLQIFTGNSVVPLASFAQLEFTSGSRQIRRRNGQVSFTIRGRVESPLHQKKVSDAGYEILRGELDMPRGYAIGEEDLISNRADEEMKDILLALVLSGVLVFLLMAILFESLLLPLSVLTTIFFAYTGAIWTLFLTGTVMDSIGWIGIIILVGVVVNNGIVLVDRIHGLRDQLDRTQAVLEGCATRVRPILMTALTTVIGLLPMAMAQPTGNGIDYRALATCVAGGLAISTFFTLWVVPVAYTVLDDLAHVLTLRLKWALRPVRKRAPATGGTAAPVMDRAD